MQQMLQLATQPSPIKAVFTHVDVEQAAVALVQHLIAAFSPNADQPSDSPRPTVHDDLDPFPDTDAVPQPPSPSSSAALVSADDGFKQSAIGRSNQRQNRSAAVRPPLPVVVQLMEMGFARRKAEAAVKQLGKTRLAF